MFSDFFNKALAYALIVTVIVSFWARAYDPRAIAKNVSKCPVHWVIDKDSYSYAAYKNERLVEYQDMLCDRGITKSSDLKLFTAQLLDENGALNETTLGDHGCSFGIIQYNACSHAGVSATVFLKRNPQWKNYRYQLHWMADQVAWRYNNYPNTRLAIVAHNNPAAADAFIVTSYYYKVKDIASSTLTVL